MLLIAASMEAALRSGIFFSAISFSWALVIEATLFLLGSPEPLTIPAALRLGDEGEAAVCVNGDDNRDLETNLILGALVEVLNELRDVDAVLTQSGAYRGRSGCLAGVDLQSDITCYFLCHEKHLLK